MPGRNDACKELKDVRMNKKSLYGMGNKPEAGGM